MNRLCTLVGSTVIAGLVGWAPPAQAQPGVSRLAGNQSVRRVARALSGDIEGVVVDDRGTPLPGAMVSALGSTSALAVTDRQGLFVLRALPVGAYLVRAHLAGFSPSRRQFVEVRSTTPVHFSLTLQRTAKSPATLDRTVPDSPKVLAAGFAGPDAGLFPRDPQPTATDGSSTTSDDHSELVWRLRHLPRSVLKETTERAAADAAKAGDPDTADPANAQPGTAAAIARAMGSSAHFLTELPVTGQVDLLTSGSFDGPTPGVLPSDNAIRGTAYVTLGGPAWQYGDWSARLLTQADIGSWFLAAAFRNRAPARHLYDVGFSYSTQRFTTTTDQWPINRTDVTGRAAGSIYGVGRWMLTPRLSLDYGARYARYDYLGGPGLLSPSVTVTLVPIGQVRVHAGFSRRMLAPGAEEFLEPLTPGLWVPPERTFIGTTPMVAERTHHYEVGVEQDLNHRLAVGFRTFYQNTTDQQVAIFGSGVPLGQELRHYAIGDDGDVVAQGWSVGITHHLLAHLRGSVAYQVTTTRWLPGSAYDGVLLVGLGGRPPDERLHDVTTSVETDLPLIATHVFLACKINTGYAHRESDTVRPGVDSRFDLQVTQRLPFLDFTSAQWQVLVGVKNLFRDTTHDSSVYDELLVVRPPTRVVGGVLVRF